ncbi:PLDc N-terminal domain-containing protein [Sphingobacterium litopenaei]|uniref:PLDc N-terminal domain-containing protein n=1 Tax=Sphingobacterium litopenaei TaxID=2763500 RepID=A0ABR7YC62_9SPHI|nr:PLDc N-terminal domain-containing protein [Sphingobacterium litopenaei]
MYILLIIIAISLWASAIYQVVKNQNLSFSQKLLWIIALLIFNVLGIIVYFAMQYHPRSWY